jgi:predicted O-methyltransferase YrrM
MTIYNAELNRYITRIFAHDETLEAVRLAIPQRGLPEINIQPEEGRFLQVLVRLCGAKKALEIGALGGYSGGWIARGLAPGGRLITLEVDPHHADVTRTHLAQLGVADRVEVRQGNAHELLRALSSEAPFDFVFIDAEKPGYPAYLEWAVEHVRIGGVIAAHNAFQSGAVARSAPGSGAGAMDAFNRKAAADPRLLSTIYPGGDGTLVAVRVA